LQSRKLPTVLKGVENITMDWRGFGATTAP